MTETVTNEVDTSALESGGPPKKGSGRLKLILLGLAIALVAVVLTLSAIFFRDTRAVDSHFEAGNDRYDQAFNELEVALQALAEVKIDGNDLSALEKESERILKRIPKAQRHLEKAREHFEDMRAAGRGWEKKTATLARKSVLQAEKGTDELAIKIQQLATTAELLSKIRAGSEKFNDGFTRTNGAINAGNEDKFEDARNDAVAASKFFAQAKTFIAQANQLVLDPELTDVGSKIGRAQRWAEGTEKMMTAGFEKKMDVYNTFASNNNKLSDEVTEAARHTVLSNPDKWMRDKLEGQNDRIQSAFAEADEYRDEALDLWENNI